MCGENVHTLCIVQTIHTHKARWKLNVCNPVLLMGSIRATVPHGYIFFNYGKNSKTPNITLSSRFTLDSLLCVTVTLISVTLKQWQVGTKMTLRQGDKNKQLKGYT